MPPGRHLSGHTPEMPAISRGKRRFAGRLADRERTWRAGGDHPAPATKAAMSAQFEHVVRRVDGEDDREAALPPEPVDEGDHAAAKPRVEAAEGFVEEEEGLLGRERPGEGDALALAPRHLPGRRPDSSARSTAARAAGRARARRRQGGARASPRGRHFRPRSDAGTGCGPERPWPRAAPPGRGGGGSLPRRSGGPRRCARSRRRDAGASSSPPTPDVAQSARSGP